MAKFTNDTEMKDNENVTIVLTGASGSGKSTLLEHLGKKLDVNCLKEVVKNITDQEKQGLSAIEMQGIILKRQARAELSILPNQSYLLDKSIVDYLAYCKHFNFKELYESYIHTTSRYKRYDHIFFLDTVPDAQPTVYENYSVDAQESMLLKEYTLQKYQIIKIPFASIEERANIIMGVVNNE